MELQVYVYCNYTVNADLQQAKVISCDSPHKSCHLQLCMQKSAIATVFKKLSVALVYLTVYNYSNVLLIRCNCTKAYSSA